jgi:RND family efflux transporter MFP subunit
VLLLIVFLLLRRHPAAEEATPAVTVETAVAVVKPMTTHVDVLGTVDTRPGHSAQISAPETSRVTAVYVAIGDVVRPGQALVQLDPAVFIAKRHEAEVALSTAQLAFNRAERLLKEGISPKKDVEAAAADLAKARSELEQARRIEALSTLRSPISGVVVTLNADLSQPIDVTQPVVEVVDPRAMEIVFHLSPNEAGRIARGAKVELTSGQEAGRNTIGIGTITGISAAVDSTTGTVDVRATIAAPSRPLKVGETLNGAILLTSAISSVVVPGEALVPAGEGFEVFVVDANHIAHATRVVVGKRTETEVEIVSGLHGGEVVVTRGAYGVADSAHVQTGTPR